MGSASSLTGRGGTAQHEQEERMFKFRIIVWRDGGFWTEPQYAVGPDAAAIRRRMVREQGAEVAAKSAVTCIAPHPIDREVVA
jgi:hypothetical protein